MHSFRRLAILSALSLATLPVFAQNPANNPPAPDQSSSQSQPAQETPQQMSVQARIRMRREQRRAAAIHDAFDHRFDGYVNLGYLRFKPGPNLQRLTFYAWDVGMTRYYSERTGITLDARGYTGTAYVGVNQYSQGAFTRPIISQYDVMAGPSYRFYLQPKYSLAGRVLAGWSRGNFSGDTNGIPPNLLGLYPDKDTYAASASLLGEYNISSGFAVRVAPEYFVTGYGSTTQNSVGFTVGFVARFGKQ